ncbi:MAG: hypothetical protein ACW976_02495, partial [Candidatus Ranarchaeia archaeon]
MSSKNVRRRQRPARYQKPPAKSYPQPARMYPPPTRRYQKRPSRSYPRPTHSYPQPQRQYQPPPNPVKESQEFVVKHWRAFYIFFLLMGSVIFFIPVMAPVVAGTSIEYGNAGTPQYLTSGYPNLTAT